MKKVKVVLILFLLSIVTTANATNWGESEVDDPILEGEKCSVHEPVSYGSYIYSWPSKYDQVFWPFTDPNGIWYCKKSGFTAFIDDFDNITPDEISTIREYLENESVKDYGIETQLRLLESIYALRKTDDAFNNRLLRTLARWYQSLDKVEKSNEYRKAALNDITNQLKEDMTEIQRLEYLYVAMNYSKQFGQIEQSDGYLTELKIALKNIEEEKTKGFAEYLNEIIEDSQYIKPGGVLDPELPEHGSE